MLKGCDIAFPKHRAVNKNKEAKINQQQQQKSIKESHEAVQGFEKRFERCSRKVDYCLWEDQKC